MNKIYILGKAKNLKIIKTKQGLIYKATFAVGTDEVRKNKISDEFESCIKWFSIIAHKPSEMVAFIDQYKDQIEGHQVLVEGRLESKLSTNKKYNIEKVIPLSITLLDKK